MMQNAKSGHFRRKLNTTFIRVSGDDAASYLQSQFSQDLSRLQPGDSCYGLWLSRKGRVVADSFVLPQADGHFLLMSYHCPQDTLIDKLEENIIADDVELTPCGGEWTHYVFWGDTAPQNPEPGKLQPLDGGQGWLQAGRHRRSLNLDVVLPGDAIPWPDQWPAEETDFAALEAQRIREAMPSIPFDIGPEDLPQEGALDLDAVSFTKGCYLGQEVMARLKAIGQAQRRLYPLIAYTPLQTGDKLMVDSTCVGLVRSTISYDGQHLALAMFQERKRQKAETFVIERIPEQQVSLAPHT